MSDKEKEQALEVHVARVAFSVGLTKSGKAKKSYKKGDEVKCTAEAAQYYKSKNYI